MKKIEILQDNGYQPFGYGYKKVTENLTHWVTLFKDDSLQMYSYYSGDPEGEKYYDTGIVTISDEDLSTLIRIFLQNHE